MKKISFSLLLLSAFHVQAQMKDSLILRSISNEIMLQGKSYEDLRILTKTIGHRLSGSLEAERAVEWARETLEKAGADTVWLQPVMVPQWKRGKEDLHIQFKDHEFENIPMLSLGNTEGTNDLPLISKVIRVGNMIEFEDLNENDVKDKIVFFDYRFRQDIINTFDGYGDAVSYRWKAVNAASRKGAAAVIIRSISTGMDNMPHAGSSHYEDDVRKIPAIAIGNHSADRLARACAFGMPLAKLISNCTFKEPVLSYNVIGEYRGKEKPEEIIVVGGHLDSWDVGEGAHDDGAGIVQSIEVLRTLKNLNISLKHTLRVICFMNEENGMKGAWAYFDSTVKEKHIFAMESDAGGFSPRGVGLMMNEALKTKVQSWRNLFYPYGVYDFEQEEGGVDISPLKKRNVPLAGLLPDSQRYFDVHHSANDVFEAVNHRELKLGSFTMAAMVYLVDQYF